MYSFTVSVATECTQENFSVNGFIQKFFSGKEDKTKGEIAISKLKFFIGDYFVDMKFEDTNIKNLKAVKKTFEEGKNSRKDLFILGISDVTCYN